MQRCLFSFFFIILFLPLSAPLPKSTDQANQGLVYVFTSSLLKDSCKKPVPAELPLSVCSAQEISASLVEVRANITWKQSNTYKNNIKKKISTEQHQSHKKSVTPPAVRFFFFLICVCVVCFLTIDMGQIWLIPAWGPPTPAPAEPDHQ